MAYTPHYFKGAGVAFANGIDFGTMENLSIGSSTSEDTVANMRNAAGGYSYYEENIDSVDFTATLLDWSIENLKIALRATSKTIASRALNISKTVATEQLIEFEDIGVVTSVTLDGQPAVSGTDYTVTAAGVYAITPGAYVIVGTYPEQVSLAALTDSNVEFKIIVALENKMYKSDKTLVKMHRVKLSPASTMALISSDQAKIEIKGKLLADETQPDGESQFFTFKRV